MGANITVRVFIHIIWNFSAQDFWFFSTNLFSHLFLYGLYINITILKHNSNSAVFYLFAESILSLAIGNSLSWFCVLCLFHIRTSLFYFCVLCLCSFNIPVLLFCFLSTCFFGVRLILHISYNIFKPTISPKEPWFLSFYNWDAYTHICKYFCLFLSDGHWT